MKSKSGDECGFVQLLGNKYIPEILRLTSIKECSALQLSEELKIPKATAYRKLKLLEDAGLIQPVKVVINSSGNEERHYRCAIREATVSFHEGNLSVDLKKMDCSKRIVRLWKRAAYAADKGNRR